MAKLNETALPGVFVITPKPIEDERGYFMEVFRRNELEAAGLCTNFVQVNQSFNRVKGTLRGLHFQHPPYQEDKLVQCVQGAILDVAVDIRKDSPTYRQWVGVELNAQNRQLLYIPKGFAHGFLTLEEDTLVSYQVSQYYAPNAQGGISWNDQAFGIDWPISPENLSERDKQHPAWVI